MAIDKIKNSVSVVMVLALGFVLVASQSNAQDKIDVKKHFKQSLAMYYSFDKKETRAVNRGTTSMHGAIHGASWSPAGKVGGALSFDGYDDYIDTKLRYSRNHKTFSMWIKSSVAKDTTVVPFGAYINDDRFYFGFNEKGLLNLGIGNMDYKRGGSSYKLDTKWHHYLVTSDANIVTLYVDGVVIMSKTVEAAPKTSYRIGALRHSRGDMVHHFKGYIDEVVILTRTLSKAEIEALYKAQK